MALTTVEQRKKDILELLQDKKVRKIFLVGEAGMGKTWMAREISDCAISQNLCYGTLWVSLNRKHDRKSLYENIASQLVFSPHDEWEDDDSNKEKEETLESLEKKILVKLEIMCEENKCLLLILDGEGDTTYENYLQELQTKLPSTKKNPFKFLISRRKSDDGFITEESEKVIEVGPLPDEELLNLLKKSIDKVVSDFPGFDSLSKAIAKKCMGLPAAAIVIAKALNYVGQHGSGSPTLESALEEASNDLTPVLCCGDDLFPSSVMIDCYWHSMQFFGKYGSVHYNELISHWIIEGYFDPTDHVENAYAKGHYILMELIDRGMLKIKEDNVVDIEGAILKMIDHRRCRFGGTASLGLACVLEDNWKGLGRVTQSDGMIKTLRSGKKAENVTTVLIDGSRFCREVPKTFIQHMQELQVLALFDLKFKKLPPSLSEMGKLLVLVLRGCDLLEDIIQIAELKTLHALEISGASSLQNIPDDFSKYMFHLRSLNLSGLQVESLPPSLFNLRELRWLILRRCSRLKQLPSLKPIVNLEMLDLSGATSLSRFQDKILASLHNLQVLDLSQTKIEKLPILANLTKLTQLLLRDCDHLTRLPNLKQLSSLKILDLSGAMKIMEIPNESLENKDNLKIIDLSGTKISKLPPNIGDLSDLTLQHCSELVKLPCTKELINLKSLDLSDASKLDRIEDEAFDHLRYLRYLNLSNTKIERLPSISKLSNLRQLVVKGCSLLENLPKMEKLGRLEILDFSDCKQLVELPHLDDFPKLEVLNLSGCWCLEIIRDESFEHISRLRTLNLSETKIKHLPTLCNPSNLCHLFLKNCKNLEQVPPLESLPKLEELDLYGVRSSIEIEAQFLEQMIHLQILKLSGIKKEFSFISNLTNLTQLSLKGCSGLETVPPLDALTKLEVLDLSETAIRSLPSLDKLSNLRELLLRNCSSLERLPHLTSLIHLEVLDLLGTRIKELPHGIPELTHLKHLDLPDLNLIEEVGWRKIKRLPGELNWDECSISESAEIPVDGKKPSVLVNGTRFFKLLKENSKLREKCLKQLFFSVFPPKEQGKDVHSYCPSDELVFSDIYFETRHFSHYKEQGQSLEIHGFDSFPTDVKDVLKHVEFISLVDMLISHMSDLDVDNLEKMKGCWLERCTKMESIFFGEEIVKLLKNLEILWVSNLPNLKSLYSGKVQSVNFQNLVHLHLDCCPMLQIVFPSHQLPVNLKTLKIQFCDKLKTVVEHNKSAKSVMGNLNTLHLLELPELTSIGAELPYLQKLKVTECPKLDSRILKLADPSVEITRTEDH